MLVFQIPLSRRKDDVQETRWVDMMLDTLTREVHRLPGRYDSHTGQSSTIDLHVTDTEISYTESVASDDCDDTHLDTVAKFRYDASQPFPTPSRGKGQSSKDHSAHSPSLPSIVTTSALRIADEPDPNATISTCYTPQSRTFPWHALQTITPTGFQSIWDRGKLYDMCNRGSGDDLTQSDKI